MKLKFLPILYNLIGEIIFKAQLKNMKNVFFHWGKF